MTMTNEVERFRSAASTMSGKRSVQHSRACKQPDALALPLDDQAVAVVFDFVKPIRAGRNFSAARRMRGR
jgi:hypothetical protein